MCKYYFKRFCFVLIIFCQCIFFWSSIWEKMGYRIPHIWFNLWFQLKDSKTLRYYNTNAHKKSFINRQWKRTVVLLRFKVMLLGLEFAHRETLLVKKDDSTKKQEWRRKLKYILLQLHDRLILWFFYLHSISST